MAASMKLVYFLGVVLVIGAWSAVDGVGECGNANPDLEAFKLAPCASAVQDVNASVSASCCSQVEEMTKNPACMCAVLQSTIAKSSGVNLEIAITIPKRCNIANRPVGYQCGAYALP